MRTDAVDLWQHGYVKSVRTALRVFETVAALQPIGLSELSRELAVPKASVQRALSTLADAGWLRHDVNRPGQWVVTARFSVLADTSPVVISARELARPHISALQARLDEPVGLFVLDGDRMVLVAATGAHGPHDLRALETGAGPLPVHVSAAGRAILSRVSPSTRDEVLDRVVPDDDPRSVSRAAVERAIAVARRDGYAVVLGEYEADLGVVAAAVIDADQAPVAGIAVFTGLGRLTALGERELGAAVSETAAAVSAAMQATAVDGAHR